MNKLDDAANIARNSLLGMNTNNPDNPYTPGPTEDLLSAIEDMGAGSDVDIAKRNQEIGQNQYSAERPYTKPIIPTNSGQFTV